MCIEDGADDASQEATVAPSTAGVKCGAVG
jgi:hypothetical protein